MVRPRKETISFVELILNSHSRVTEWSHAGELRYRVRRSFGDALHILLTNLYIVSVSDVVEAKKKWPALDVLVTGSAWNQVSAEARAYGRENGVAVCRGQELSAVLAKRHPATFEPKPATW